MADKIISNAQQAWGYSEAVAQRVEFGPLVEEKKAAAGRREAPFKKVKMTVTAELGEAQITVRELLDLDVGSIITLNKLADETVKLLLNDRVVAQGEVVVINDNYGVRVTVLSDEEEGDKKEG